VQAKAVFIAAIVTEAIVVFVWYKDVMAFLWLNVVGCFFVCLLSWVLQKVLKKQV
jgi:solute:Na+ symporter, SSS family